MSDDAYDADLRSTRELRDESMRDIADLLRHRRVIEEHSARSTDAICSIADAMCDIAAALRKIAEK